MHYEKVEERKSQYTKCPICSEERKELLANHDNLIQYLTKVHTVSIEQYNFSFRNMEEFVAWTTPFLCSPSFEFFHSRSGLCLYYKCKPS
jgi:hypothetical protein